jgi:HSP20 family protein
MKNNLLKTALLATLPWVAIQADSNLSAIQDPFANDPMFKHFQKLHEEMNRAFAEFNQAFFADMQIEPQLKSHFAHGFATTPRTDFIDKGDHYELKVDLPGMEAKSIDVKVKDHLISIHAKSEEKREEKKNDKIIRQERLFGEVQRTLTLPNDANPEKYKTDYKNGVLTVTIEKK